MDGPLNRSSSRAVVAAPSERRGRRSMTGIFRRSQSGISRLDVCRDDPRVTGAGRSPNSVPDARATSQNVQTPVRRSASAVRPCTAAGPRRQPARNAPGHAGKGYSVTDNLGISEPFRVDRPERGRIQSPQASATGAPRRRVSPVRFRWCWGTVLGESEVRVFLHPVGYWGLLCVYAGSGTRSWDEQSYGGDCLRGFCRQAGSCSF